MANPYGTGRGRSRSGYAKAGIRVSADGATNSGAFRERLGCGTLRPAADVPSSDWYEERVRRSAEPEQRGKERVNTPRDRWVEAAIAAKTNPLPVVEVGIPMRDGIELAADVYLPAEVERPAPAIVTMTPYDKTPRFPEI